MKRSTQLLLLAAVLVIGYVVALVGRDAPPPRVAAEPQAVLPPPSEPVPRPARTEPDRERPGPPVQHVDMIKPGERAYKKPVSPVPMDLPEEERRRLLMEMQREQREKNERRIGIAEARWEQEQREASWAEPHEKALQQALVGDGIDSLLMDVECRSTLCRVEIAAIDSNAAAAMVRAERFREELGEQVATRMAGGGLDRVMVIYAARDETSLDP